MGYYVLRPVAIRPSSVSEKNIIIIKYLFVVFSYLWERCLVIKRLCGISIKFTLLVEMNFHYIEEKQITVPLTTLANMIFF